MERKFKFAGTFGSFSFSRTDIYNRPARTIVTSGGFSKIGCFILTLHSGFKPTISTTLAGRVIGFTDLKWESRKVSRVERSGLGGEIGTYGREWTFSTTRIGGKHGKNGKTRSFRVTFPTVKIGRNLWPGLTGTFRFGLTTVAIG
jgi:hypothetical protein